MGNQLSAAGARQFSPNEYDDGPHDLEPALTSSRISTEDSTSNKHNSVPRTRSVPQFKAPPAGRKRDPAYSPDVVAAALQLYPRTAVPQSTHLAAEPGFEAVAKHLLPTLADQEHGLDITCDPGHPPVALFAFLLPTRLVAECDVGVVDPAYALLEPVVALKEQASSGRPTSPIGSPWDPRGDLGPSHRIPLDPLGGPWTLGPLDPRYRAVQMLRKYLAKSILRLGPTRALALFLYGAPGAPPWASPGNINNM